MSFRGRLMLFFLLVVIVPMIAVGLLLFVIIGESERGKVDAALRARLESADNVLTNARAEGTRAARAVAQDVAFAQALRRGDTDAAAARARTLLRTQEISRIVVARGTRALVDVGDVRATFPGEVRLLDAGRQAGVLQASVITAGEYVRRVKQVAEVDAIVVREGAGVLASTLRGADNANIPEKRSRVPIGGTVYRVTASEENGFLGERLRVATLGRPSDLEGGSTPDRAIAAAFLAGFFLLAIVLGTAVSRSLRGQIDAFLLAARRVGSGEFATQVPVTGRDEFALLGVEFNKMARQLQARMQDLGTERGRLQEAMRRIGETFASNLDREALLEIVVKTAVDGVGAEAGRASVRPTVGEPLEQVAITGDVHGLKEAIRAAEAKVLETGRPSEATVDGASALSHPLRRDEHTARVSGVVSVARAGAPFTAGEQELFHYLAGQAAVSIENVGLHETVERQAVTDELTGLFNRRRFEEAMTTEVERARRFGQPLGLVLLDIDDFKRVNDTYGHQQGDLVLREVARVLRESSREIDEPARYGGEELAVVLPNTDLDGAYNLAERVRAGIEQLNLPLLDGPGSLHVTASLGVATLPGSADDMPSLFQAADDALYRAKRAGKNRTERAEGATRLSEG